MGYSRFTDGLDRMEAMAAKVYAPIGCWVMGAVFTAWR